MNAVDELRAYCDFSDNRVYVLMAQARKKENPVTSSEEIIWREVLRDETDIERKVRKLRAAAQGYNPPDFDDPTFRLYVTANARAPVNAHFEFKQRQDKWFKSMYHGDENVYDKIKRLDSHWISELQRPHSRDEKLLQLDVDQKFEGAEQAAFEEFLDDVTEVLWLQETPNGWHYIVEPYNYVNKYMEDIDYEAHGDGLLFIEYLTEP